MQVCFLPKILAFTFKFMILFELTVMNLGSAFTFCTWTSNFPSITFGKDHHSAINWLNSVVEIQLNQHIWVYL